MKINISWAVITGFLGVCVACRVLTGEPLPSNFVQWTALGGWTLNVLFLTWKGAKKTK